MSKLSTMLVCLVVLCLSSCAKVKTNFQLHFYPAGTGLLNNDWEQVANVNVSTRAASWLTGESANRVIISIQKKGGEPEVVYTGEWSTTKIISVQGYWDSATQFQLQILPSIDGDNLPTTTIEIDSK